MGNTRQDAFIPEELDLGGFLTPKFFKAVETEQLAQIPLSFPLPEKAETLREFLSSEDGKKFRTGVEGIVTQLKDWITIHIPALENKTLLEKFYDSNFKNYEGLDPEMNEVKILFFKEGVPLLAGIVEKLKSDQHSLEKRRTAISNLLPGLHVCSPGIFTNITNAYLQLSTDVPLILMTKRKIIAEEVIKQILRVNGIVTPQYTGNEIHNVNAILNSYAPQLGIPILYDEYQTPLIFQSPLYYAATLDFPEEITLALTAEAIISQIIMEKSHNALEALQGMTMETSTSKLTAIEEDLNLYGHDADFNFYHIIDEDGNPRKAQDLEYYLTNTILIRLGNEGFLDLNQLLPKSINSGTTAYFAPSGSFTLAYVITDGERMPFMTWLKQAERSSLAEFIQAYPLETLLFSLQEGNLLSTDEKQRLCETLSADILKKFAAEIDDMIRFAGADGIVEGHTLYTILSFSPLIRDTFAAHSTEISQIVELLNAELDELLVDDKFELAHDYALLIMQLSANPETAYLLGELYSKNNKYEEAITWFKKSDELNADTNPNLHSHIINEMKKIFERSTNIHIKENVALFLSPHAEHLKKYAQPFFDDNALLGSLFHTMYNINKENEAALQTALDFYKQACLYYNVNDLTHQNPIADIKNAITQIAQIENNTGKEALSYIRNRYEKLHANFFEFMQIQANREPSGIISVEIINNKSIQTFITIILNYMIEIRTLPLKDEVLQKIRDSIGFTIIQACTIPAIHNVIFQLEPNTLKKITSLFADYPSQAISTSPLKLVNLILLGSIYQNSTLMPVDLGKSLVCYKKAMRMSDYPALDEHTKSMVKQAVKNIAAQEINEVARGEAMAFLLEIDPPPPPSVLGKRHTLFSEENDATTADLKGTPHEKRRKL